MNNSRVRIVSGDQTCIDINMSSVELFRKMNPNYDSPGMCDVLNDIIFIAIKEICYRSIEYNSAKFSRFDARTISNMIVKYVFIYMGNKDRNLLVLLNNVLIDTFLSGSEKNDHDFKMFFSSIHSKVIGLLP